MVDCSEETTLRRPISVHSLVDHDNFALLYAVVGNGTEWLTHLKKGGTLDVLGPLGNGFINAKKPAETLCFLSGLPGRGIGIAPLRFLIEKVIPSCRQIIILRGAVTAAKLYPKELAAAGSQHCGSHRRRHGRSQGLDHRNCTIIHNDGR